MKQSAITKLAEKGETMSEMTGEEITKRALDEFVVWCRSHDPYGEWSVLESVGRYHKWCEKADRIVAWLEADAEPSHPLAHGEAPEVVTDRSAGQEQKVVR